jgi:hypothetical protein
MCELNARLVKAEKLGEPLVCTCCDQELNLHQPDENRPSQLLATCEGCCRWFSLIELNDEDGEMIMIELPGRSVIDEIVARLSVKH